MRRRLAKSREAPGFVKHVMQRHGGELDIVSAPDRGSTFRLVLPSVRVRVTETLPVEDAVPVEDAAGTAELAAR